jgi:hypothetical protein
MSYVTNNSGGPQDVEGMLDTVTANPDATDFAVPPDGVRGASTIAKQKIATSISWEKAGGGGPYDLWIVQWDHESTRKRETNAVYMCSEQPEDTAGYFPGNLVPVTTVAPGWVGAGYTVGMVTGGLCIYYMKQNTSPFPSADGAVLGPVAPVFVDQLLFADDVLHDNMRVLGSNYELCDTTNALNQQGNCYQGSWDANQEDDANFSLVDVQPTLINSGNAAVRQAQCPPGIVEDLIKQPANRMAAAKMGTFVMNRLDMSDNSPSSSFGNNTVYESIDTHPLLNGRRLYLVARTTNNISIISASGLSTFQRSGTQTCRCWMTAVQMNVTVFSSLNLTYAATISREIIAQCFIRPGSRYAAFARMNHGRKDSVMLDRLQNVMDELQMFQPSDSNRNGKFAKAAKTLWKKAVPIVKGAIGVANVVAPGLTKKAAAAANAATGGLAGEVVGGVKKAKKLKKKIKKELAEEGQLERKPKFNGPQNPGKKFLKANKLKMGEEELAAIMSRLYNE